MKRICLFSALILPLFLLGQQFTVYNIANSMIPDNLIKTINVDSKGTVWFVTGDCFSGGYLVSLTNNMFTLYDTADGIPDRFVTCIAFDTNEVMWCGSRYHGISSFDGKTWKNYNPLNSNFPDKHVRSIAVDKNNRVWAGTDNGLAIFCNDKWDIADKSNSALPDNIVNSVAFDKNSDAIWIATDKGVLWAYHYGAIKRMIDVAPIIYTKLNSLLPDDQVNQIVVDDSGYVWISSWDGIVKVENNKWKVYTPSNSKLPPFVEYILTPHNNEIWISSNMGLYVLTNQDEWRNYTPSNSAIPDFFVNRVVFDKEGNAWIATQSGLAKLPKQ